METDSKSGMARSKFEKLIEKAVTDTVKNVSELIEAYNYLGYYYLQNNNFSKSKEYYFDMIAVAPNDKDNKIKAYTSLASLENAMGSNEKTLETKIPYVNRAIEWYNKILSFDPNNESARDAIQRYTNYRKQLEAGINPNELKGTVKSAAGQPVANASIRVKDTAAETYTNPAGAFKFEIPQASETLIITAKGFKTKEIAVTRPLKPLNVILEL
jgi:tetratricopeptide (TPR) repeat protein